MVTNFIKIGDEWALVLHPAILELFNLDADTEFEVTAEHGKLFIRPIGKQIS